jgi:tetratricopeptide (TPR) repeat protein
VTTAAQSETAGARLAAFLCAEFAEASETLARLGEARADEVKRTASRLLRERMAAAGGDDVRPLPDGFVAAFPTASKAVACAVALQRACERHNARTAEPLHLRVGIQVGEAAAGAGGDDAAKPGAAAQARELCRAAGGGQILVSGLVHALAARGGRFRFERTGLLPLEGDDEPTPTFEARYERAPALRLPLPPEPADDGGDAPAFVGRAAELRRLEAAWADAAAGARQVVFVSGEPGIGKTRLAGRLAREAHARGALVLWGRCFEEALVPYQPFVQALRHVVAHEDPDELRAQLGVHAATLAHLVPELETALTGEVARRPRDDPAHDRYRLFRSVSTFLAELSASAPVLLVLDDLQWGDSATLHLLRHLAADTAQGSLLLLGTYRDSEVTRSHPLAQAQADVERDRVVVRIALEGLVEEEVGDLVGSLVGRTPPPALTRSLRSESSGNPFFLQELVRDLEELRLLENGGGAYGSRVSAGGLGVPTRVRELVSRRLQRLSPPTHDALSLGSVIGSEFPLDVLAALLGTPEDELIELMDEAIEARLLVETDRLGHYGFSHALIHHALYEEHSANRRASLHYRVGAALEQLRADDVAASLPGIAYHYGAAGPRAADKVLRYCPEAGERALELVAYEDAVHYFRSALEAHATLRTADDAARADLLVRLGTAQTRAGDATGALESFREAAELARRVGDGATLARAALGYGGGAGFGGIWVTFGGVDEVLVGLLEDALVACPEPGPLRVRLLGRLAQALYWSAEPTRSLELSEEALASARRLGDPTAVAYALDSRHVALWGPDDLEERMRLANEMLALGQEVADRDIQLEAYSWLITDALEADSLEDVDRYLDAHARIAEGLRQPYHLWYTQVVRAMRAYMAGRYDETERLAAEALSFGRHAHAANAAQTLRAQMLFVARERGRLEDVVESLEEYVAASPLPNWHLGLALTYGDLGRRDDALAELEFFANGDRFLRVPRDCLWFATLGTIAQVVGRLDAAEYAEPLLALLEPYDDRNCVIGGAILCFGPMSRMLGTLARVAGDTDRALAYLDDALARSLGLGSPPLVARTNVERAKTLLARRAEGDVDEAGRLLDEAAETARTIGMVALGREIDAVREDGRREAALT